MHINSKYVKASFSYYVAILRKPFTAPLKLCSFPRWNGWFCPMIVKIIDQLVAVIAAFCKYTASFQRNMLQQGYSKINIIVLSLTHHGKNGIVIGIYRCMDFCTGSSTTMSDFSGLPLFWSLHCADALGQSKRL